MYFYFMISVDSVILSFLDYWVSTQVNLFSKVKLHNKRSFPIRVFKIKFTMEVCR